jgi:ABC-type multidrug transport system fused ATPase/permease subunit
LFTKILGSYLKDTTVLIATHRLNTIKKVDKILVLDQGSLVEMGTHKKLIDNKYKYYDFVKALEVRSLENF